MICMQSWKKVEVEYRKLKLNWLIAKSRTHKKKQNSGQVNGKEQRFYSELEGEW